MTAFYNKHKNTIMMLTAIVIAVTTAFLTINTYGIRFQTNDDATLSNIAAGAYGSDTLHMVYVNVIFSALLRPLYAVCQTNWYVIVQLVFVVVSIAVIGYILMKKLGMLCGSVMMLALMMGFAMDVFYTFQYTECGFIVLTAGLLLIVDNLGRINKSTMAGIVLALIGSLIRWDVFYAVGGLSAPLLLYRFFPLDKAGKKKAVITMCLLFAATFGAKAVDIVAYKADDGWDEFRKYNEVRTAYSDYKFYSLTAENPFGQYGITDADYTMLNNWNYYDEEKFTIELLNTISQGNPQITAAELMDKTFERIKDMLKGDIYRWMFLLVAALSLVSLRPRWSGGVMITVWGLYGVLMLYLVYRMRITSWVELGLIWTVSVFVLYCISQSKINSALNFLAMTAVLGAIICISRPVYKQLYIDYPNYVEWAQLEEPYFAAMTQDKENLYLIATQSINPAAGYDVINPRGKDFFSNIVAYGGWMSRAPHRDKALADYGLTRPLVDAVDNPNVYLDYHCINEAVEYVKGQLGVEVYAVITGENAYAPYQLVTQLSE